MPLAQLPHGPLRSYGRIKSRTLKPRQADLPDACLERVFILFPDPWPKTRHHKRRLIQDEVVVDLVRVLKPGGSLRFATDWADYADWALRRFLVSPGLQWTATRADDWR